jgi:hypothetical protein
MIGYIASRTMRMIRRRWKIHMWLALQMAVGVALIYACACLYVSAAEEYRMMREEIGGTIWDIEIARERPASRPPLDYGQYARLKERFPGVSLPFIIVHNVFYTTDGADIHTGRLVFASDDFLEFVLQADRPGFERGSAAYAGEGIRGLLEGRYRLIHGHMPLEPAAAGLAAADGTPLAVLPMEGLGAGRTRFTHHHLEEVPLDQTVLLPLAAYDPLYTPETAPENAALFLLSVRFGRDADADDAIGAYTELLGQLLRWNGEDWNYSPGPVGRRLLDGLEKVRTGAAAAGGIAGLCMLIVLIGLTAVVQLRFLRRRKTFAICSALGARRGALFAEMLLEAALPSCAGGIAGIAVCSRFLSEWAHMVPVRQSPDVMTAAAALALAPGLLAAWALASRFRRLRPLEILRRDQM